MLCIEPRNKLCKAICFIRWFVLLTCKKTDLSEELVGEEVLNLGRDLGKRDKEGQRVMQVHIVILSDNNKNISGKFNFIKKNYLQELLLVSIIRWAFMAVILC